MIIYSKLQKEKVKKEKVKRKRKRYSTRLTLRNTRFLEDLGFHVNHGDSKYYSRAR